MEDLEWGTVDQRLILQGIKKLTLPCAHSYACSSVGMSEQEGVHTYLYSWLENQVMAAIKSVPLGQVAGQKILQSVLESLPELIEEIFNKIEHQVNPINTFSMQLSVLSARHESQYSRLFRS
jgi:urease accessory protein